MPRYSYPDSPVLTLYGTLHTSGSIGVDKYGISDSTGLGPNGTDIYRTYSTTIENIQAQNIGDNSVRGGKGLSVGGQYNGFDITVGCFISNQDATRIFQILDIYDKTETSVEILYEDVWMSIAKSRSDRINFFGRGEPVIVFTVSDENIPLISWTGTDYFTTKRAIDRLQTYFSVYKPNQHFTFYSVTGADVLSAGDLITATGGAGDAYLIKISSPEQVIVGQVAQIFGGNNVIINANRRIITNFDDPPRLVGGQIGDIWYSDELGGYNLVSSNNKTAFFQITNAISTHIIGETLNPTFDQTQYDLLINGITVIPGGTGTGDPAMSLADIISNINGYSGTTYTVASDDGGKLRLDRSDGGDIMTQGSWVTYTTEGQEIYSTSRGTPPYVMFLDSSASGTGGATGAGLEVLDEGTPIGVYSSMNFIGVDVLSEDSGVSGQVNIYIPPPNFASHFNTTDGTTNGLVAESLGRNIVRISSPTSEGAPYFKTNTWAGSNHSSTIDPTPAFSTNAVVTGFSPDISGDSIITATVYDADGTTKLATFNTPVVYQNAIYNSIGTDAGITITIEGFAADTTKWKADVSVDINMYTVFGTHNLDGGRYHVYLEHFTDTLSDGGGTYTYTQSDVFYDTNNSTPNINGNMTLIESTTPANILTKHISGVEYYILNSEFETTVSNIDDFNENTQGRVNTATYNFRITGADYGLPTRNLEAWNLGAYGTWNATWTNSWNLQDAAYEYNDWPITNNNFRYRGAAANGTSTVYDPWADGNTRSSPNDSILVDTFNDNSTRLGEDFDGETERLTRGGASYTVWSSTTILDASITGTGTGIFCDSCIVGSNVLRPDRFFLTDPNTNTIQANLGTYSPDKGGTNPNYLAYSDIAVYHRKFYTTIANVGEAISSFVMTFGGNPGLSADFSEALENSDLRVYIRRVNAPGLGSFGFNANPLSVHGNLFNSGSPTNPYDDGASGVDTPGALIRTANGGNSIPATFGTGTPASEGFWIELQIIDPNIKIDYINVTLNFSSGGTDSAPV